MDDEDGVARNLVWGGSLGGLCASLLAVVLAGGVVVWLAPSFEDPAAVGAVLMGDGFRTFALWSLLLYGAALVACAAGSWWLRPRGPGGGRGGPAVLGGLLGFGGVTFVPFATALYLAGVR